MNFDFDDDQTLLRETVRRFLEERQPLATVRTHLEDPDVFDPALWAQGAELGFAAMLVPESHGGGSITAQPLVDLVVYAEELGRLLNPGPLLVTNVVTDALARGADEDLAATWLPQLVSGSAVATWCVGAAGTPEPETLGVEATVDGEVIRLDGVARYAHEAASASLLLVTALLDGAAVLVAVPAAADGVQVTRQTGIDLTRRFGMVSLSGVVVERAAVLSGGAAAVQRACDVATVIKCAEATGAAAVLFEQTVEYLRDRVQFGRTIASYQAIKHRLADLQIEVEAMRAATYYAALALGDDLHDASEAVATAGAFVPAAFARLTGESLQLHGGIGFTWEHDVHLFVRRSKSDEPLYGDPRWHRERLLHLVEERAQGGRA